jgi:hypothetical protein
LGEFGEGASMAKFAEWRQVDSKAHDASRIRPYESPLDTDTSRISVLPSRRAECSKILVGLCPGD